MNFYPYLAIKNLGNNGNGLIFTLAKVITAYKSTTKLF
jgi:hypothetical protein